MKIAVIGTRGGGPARDGVDRALAELCPRLMARGHQIDVFSERNGRSISPIDGTRMIRLPAVPSGFGMSPTHTVMSSLISAFRGYDVVNFVAADAPSLFTLAAKLGMHRTVVSVHGLDPLDELFVPPPLGAESMAARFADVITVVSRRLERYFRDTFGRETIYIPNGVTPRATGYDPAEVASQGLEPGRYLLLADRLVRASGAMDAIRAVCALETDHVLAIAETGEGDQAYRHDLWRQSDRNRVRFLGRVDRPLLDALTAHAYLYLLPASSPETPPSLLDALGQGCAVVASDQPEHLDVVGADGFTFTSGDPGDLKRVLMWLLDDPEVVRRMGKRAASAARHRFSWDRIADAYEQVYSSIV